MGSDRVCISDLYCPRRRQSHTLGLFHVVRCLFDGNGSDKNQKPTQNPLLQRNRFALIVLDPLGTSCNAQYTFYRISRFEKMHRDKKSYSIPVTVSRTWQVPHLKSRKKKCEKQNAKFFICTHKSIIQLVVNKN